MEFQLSEARPNDYQDIATIYNFYIPPNGYTMECELHSKEDIQKWVKKFNDRETLIVGKIAGQPIAWGIIKRYSDRLGYQFACETAVYIHPNQLGKGYGSQIKQHLLKRCQELKYRHIVAKIWADNTASIIYNQKLGFEIVGIQKKIGFKNGQWIDVVIMQYVFSNIELSESE